MAEPLSRDDVLDAANFLRTDRVRLLDFGIQLSVWMQRAVCSTHGVIQRMTVSNGEPPVDFQLTCMACKRDNTKRHCRVTSLERLTGQELPDLGRGDNK